mmetsp:Transcript_23083/g.64529  ORF Transcript_23083/g.64529 Transcript_23083/m.64529 type:complete len:407 (+) Transcript_23083:196-1416(+)
MCSGPPHMAGMAGMCGMPTSTCAPMLGMPPPSMDMAAMTAAPPGMMVAGTFNAMATQGAMSTPGLTATPTAMAAPGAMTSMAGMGGAMAGSQVPMMMPNHMMTGGMAGIAGMGAGVMGGMAGSMLPNAIMMGNLANSMLNPMMMANPMMMGGVAGMPNMAGMAGMTMGAVLPGMPNGLASAAGVAEDGQVVAPAKPLVAEEKADPQVVALCRDFNVEDRLMRKLNNVLMRRPETIREDIVSLREKLGAPRAEIGVLITQLEKGIFVSKSSMHPDLVALVDKYQLDNRASERLVESMARRKETRKQDLKDLDIRLASADRPSGLLMKLLQGLDQDGKLPPAPRSLGLPGSSRDHSKRQLADEDNRRQHRGRAKSKSRSRAKSKSRSKSSGSSKSKSKSKRSRSRRRR